MQVIISTGGQFHALHLAHQLEKRGYLKKLIIPFFRGLRDDVDPSHIKKLLLPSAWGKIYFRFLHGRNRHFGNYIKDALFSKLATKYIEKCDIFVGWSGYSLKAMRKAKEMGAMTVVERGSAHMAYQSELLREEYELQGVTSSLVDNPWLNAKKNIELKEYEEADYIAVPSHFAKRSFIEKGVSEQKLICVPYGVDISHFRPVTKKDDVFRIVFCGAMAIQKGVHYLLEAIKQLSLPNAELILVGSMRDDFRSMLARYEGVFTYMGAVDYQKLPRYYADSSLFVLPSIQDGFAMVVTEAMASGLPVIVSENVGAKDIVRNGTDGFIIPIRDVGALKEKILFFYENDEERKRMGESAREYVKQFTWERYGRELIEVYQKICRAKIR